MFQGDNFDDWVDHFGIGNELKSLLTDTGVDFVVDLVEVLSFPDVLDKVEEQTSAAEFERFLNACGNTEALVDVALPKKSGASPLTTQSSNTANTSAEDVAANIRIAELQLKLDALNMPSVPQLTATDLRIQRMEEEIRRLEMESSVRKSSKKVSAKAEREKEARATLDETRRRRRMIDVLSGTLQTAASLDVVFALDCTGSMGSFIDAARDNMRELVDSLARLYPDIPLRVAFVGYRDHCDGLNRLAVLRLTTDLAAFNTIISKQQATGGGDGPEDIHGALKIVETMEWRSATRILYHIGDYPCHGRPEFHDLPDDYPGGDPHGLKADHILRALQDQQVQYYFGKITNSTDKMIARFNEIMKGDRPFVTTTPLNAATMMSVVTSSVSSSLTPTLSTSARTDGGSVKMKNVDLVLAVPDYSALTEEHVVKIGVRVPASVAELVMASTDACLQIPDLLQTRVKIAPYPFAKGAMKAAYYAQNCASSSPVVLKESMAESTSQLTLAKYESVLSNYAAASFLAAQFNRMAPEGCEGIRFCEVAMLQMVSRAEQPYFIQEEQLVGTFEKFNNNAGYCQPSPTIHGTEHNAVQAFSHWTHHVTGGALMVVDCQGIYDAASKTFKLTDPAVHCTTLTRFGGTNLGKIGFKRFFKTHVCNAHCAALSLPAGV
eukprot:gene21282-27305_t